MSGFSAGGTGLTGGEITANASAGTIVIDGTPTASGSASFTVNVIDTVGGNAHPELHNRGRSLPTPVLTWSNPANITYDTALGNTQLDATASDRERLPTPRQRDGAPRRQRQRFWSLSRRPTPRLHRNDQERFDQRLAGHAHNYLTESGGHRLRHGGWATQLDATASVPGSLIIRPPANGASCRQRADTFGHFRPTDTTDYTTATKTMSINVLEAAPTMISDVVVAEATRQDGVLQSNEKLKITWAATNTSGITSQT